MTPHEMFVALQIDYCDAYDLLDWARSSEHFDTLYDDFQVLELLSMNRGHKAQRNLVTEIFYEIVARHWPQISMTSPKSRKIAKALYFRRLRSCVGERCKPWDLYKMLTYLEEFFDYPEWLGSTYNLCDWMQGDSTWAYFVDLQRECEALLLEYGDEYFKAEKLFLSGKNETGLKALRSMGFSQMASIKFVRNVLQGSLKSAKELVHSSSVWADQREFNDRLHDEIIPAFIGDQND